MEIEMTVRANLIILGKIDDDNNPDQVGSIQLSCCGDCEPENVIPALATALEHERMFLPKNDLGSLATSIVKTWDGDIRIDAHNEGLIGNFMTFYYYIKEEGDMWKIDVLRRDDERPFWEGYIGEVYDGPFIDELF